MSDAVPNLDVMTPPDSPMTIQDVVESETYRDLCTPKLSVGDPAFDFSLPLLDASGGRERPTGRAVRLSDYAGVRPVALIFGSYT